MAEPIITLYGLGGGSISVPESQADFYLHSGFTMQAPAPVEKAEVKEEVKDKPKRTRKKKELENGEDEA